MAYRFLDGITKLSQQNLSALGGTLEDVAPYVPQSNIPPALQMGGSFVLPIVAESYARRAATPLLSRALGSAMGNSIGRSIYAPIYAGFEAADMFGIPGVIEGRFGRELRGAYNYGANMGRQMPFLAYFLQKRLERGSGNSPAQAARPAISSAIRGNIPTGRINANMPPRHPATDVGGSSLVASPSTNDYSESSPSSMSAGNNPSRSISGRLAARASRPNMIARSILRQRRRTA